MMKDNRANSRSLNIIGVGASRDEEELIVNNDIHNYPIESNVPYRTILLIILISNLWTLILTLVPVIANVGPDNYYAHHPGWYTGDDVIRFIEPIGGTPLNFLVLYKSGIFYNDEDGKLTNRTVACLTIFFLGLAIYGQGAGFHSAANMFKNALETLPAQDDQVQDLHYYMQTIWEHDTGHYLYAIGLAIMHACQAYAYRDVKAPQMGLTNIGKLLLFLSSAVLGLLIAGVAIEFPSGTIVGLIYLIFYGMGVIGGFLFYQYRYAEQENKEKLFYGQRPVLHHFFLGYVWALIIVIAWIIVVGGFKSRSQATST